MSRPVAPSEPSDAILTLPNLVTFARLGLVPVFLWLGLATDNVVAAFVVGGIAGSTDWIDGRLARRMGQVSKLGTAMDPLVDRVLVAAAAWIIIANEYAPLWAVVAVLARDALVLAAVPFLSARDVPRPAVSWWGKAATTGVMFGFGFWIGKHMTSPPTDWLGVVGWICYIPGLVFSYVAAAGYAADVRRALRSSAA